MTGSSFYSVEKIADGGSGGATQAETRVYNERLIVSLVRRHGQLSKADLTRLTGLAPQTITTIVNRAAAGGLLLRREPLRGRLGQPSVPYALNPEAAYAFGLRVDHLSADIAFVNFVGEVVAFERTGFEATKPEGVMAFTRSAITRICRKHKAIAPERIAGLGIALPFQHWDWGEEAAPPTTGLRPAREIDIRAELDRLFDWPVFLLNDAMVAAGAELMFGAGLGRPDFLYAYVGQAIGGGLVLDHHLFPGRNKLAGALGEFRVPARRGGQADAALQRIVALQALADRLGPADAERIRSSPEDWSGLEGALPGWIDEVADGLAFAAQGTAALLDIDTLVIDGAMPRSVRKEIARAARQRLARLLLDRPEPFTVVEGTFGHLAPAIGGASIPLLIKYSNDKDLLFKE